MLHGEVHIAGFGSVAAVVIVLFLDRVVLCHTFIIMPDISRRNSS